MTREVRYGDRRLGVIGGISSPGRLRVSPRPVPGRVQQQQQLIFEAVDGTPEIGHGGQFNVQGPQ
jgi:hypothetical protein